MGTPDATGKSDPIRECDVFPSVHLWPTDLHRLTDEIPCKSFVGTAAHMKKMMLQAEEKPGSQSCWW